MVENWCDDERDVKSSYNEKVSNASNASRVTVKDMAKAIATQDYNGYDETKYVVYNYKDYNKGIEDYILEIESRTRTATASATSATVMQQPLSQSCTDSVLYGLSKFADS